MANEVSQVWKALYLWEVAIMTHFKDNWMRILTNRMLANKRVIIKTNILPSFLIHLIKQGHQSKRVVVIHGIVDTVLMPCKGVLIWGYNKRV